MSTKNDDSQKPERLAKVIAAAGVCSRRKAEELILSGKVEVDGEVITNVATNVFRSQKILVDGKQTSFHKTPEIWCFYKPKGVITTHNDPQGRTTLFSLMPSFMPRVVSVGRLDYNSEGLIILTTSGELAHKLEKSDLIRKYRTRVFGKVKEEHMDVLRNGMTIDGIRYAPIKVSIDSYKGTNTWLTIELTEGKNREIRKTLGYFEYQVNRLIRVGYGPFELGTLKPGEMKRVMKIPKL